MGCMSNRTPQDEPVDDDAIRAVVKRLSRPHKSGGKVIERAAILAEGPGSGAILDWIMAHAGEPEAIAVSTASHGLHGGRMHGGASAVTPSRAPSRYVLPAGTL
jgi:hypothetical protein